MGGRVFNYQSYYVTKMVIESAVGLNSDDLAKLKVESDPERGVDLYALLATLAKKYKEARKIIGDTSNIDAATIAMDLQKEKVIKERIHNQAKLGVLIPKNEALNRMIAILSKNKEMVMGYIRSVANDMTSTNPVKIKPTTRAWVEYLVTKFNDLFDKFKDDELSIRSWESDGSTSLLRTRLQQAMSDQDVDELLLKQGGVNESVR